MSQPAANESTVVRNAATLVLGNVGARAVTLALTPVITRIFAPEAFGAFAGLLSLAAMGTAVCHLRYPMAVYLPEDRTDADSVALLSLGVMAGFCVALAALTPLAGQWVSRQLDMTASPGLIWLLAPMVFLGGVIFLLQQVATRDKLYKGMAAAPGAMALTDRTATISLGAGGLTSGWGLGWGKLIGLTAQAGVLAATLGRARLNAIFSARKHIGTMARRYRQFPTYSPTALLHQASLQMPVLLLAFYFQSAVAGLYALSMRMLREPLNLFGQALARVFYDRASELQRSGQGLDRFTMKFFTSLMRLCILPLLLVGLTAPELFGMVFGGQWQESGSFARLLTPFYVLVFFSWPLGALFDLLEKQRQRLYFDMVYFAASLGSLVAGGLTGNPLLAVGLFSAAASTATLARVLWLASLAGMPVPQGLLQLGGQALLAALFAAPVAVVRFTLELPWLTLTSAGICLGGFMVMLWRTDPLFAETVARIVRRKTT